MNFLIDLFRKAVKGDNFRTTATPFKYDDKINQLNSVNPNQSTRLSTSTINQIQKTGNSVLSQNSSKSSILPGS